MQTEIKIFEINRVDYRYDQDYLNSKLKEIETLGVDQQYALSLNCFYYEGTKKIFEALFVKQKPNLLEMELINMKLLPNSFKLFTEKRW